MPRFELERARWIRIRIGVLVLAMVACAVAVAHGAFDLGVTRRDELNALAQSQYKRRITVPARRGMITDRHGEELAVEVEIDSVYAKAVKIENPAASATLLSSVLGVSEDLLRKRLSSKKHFVWLDRQVSPDVAEKVKALGIEGVELIKESKRFYPNRSLASHVIGFAGIDAVGLEGVELKFDEQLKGRRNAVLGMRDAKGQVVFADSIFGPEGVVGNTVELTIDKTLQYISEQELAHTISTFNAKAGQIIIMEPNTGEVLALANWPTYNPNSVSDSFPKDRRNRAVLDVLEPGSTFKVFTLAAALNAGVVRPDELIFCERGRMEFGETRKVTIRDDHKDGWLNPIQCLKRSSNICFAKMSSKLGKKRLYHYLRRFGFGEKPHMDLPFEAGGTLHHYKKWYDVDAAYVSFGQGVGVTGMQMVSALSAVANGGTLMRPLLVKRIVNPGGETVRTFNPEARRRVVSRYTARLVGDIMTSVTEEGGTGIQGSVEGHATAGKTGTAQKADGAKGYDKTKWVSSFMSFVPADNPRLAISVIIDEPLINHYGGTVAAPALSRVADQALRYLGVSPKLSKSKRKKSNSVAVTEKVPPDPGSAEATETDEVVLNENQVRAPDLIGMTMKQTMETLSVHELRPLLMGTGFAVEQVPRPGDPIDKGEFVQVNFEPEEFERVPRATPSDDLDASVVRESTERETSDDPSS